jgi:hypothetical protein
LISNQVVLGTGSVVRGGRADDGRGYPFDESESLSLRQWHTGEDGSTSLSAGDYGHV